MGLLDDFDKGYAGGLNMQYSKKERENAYRMEMANLAMKQAEAQNAPEYFGSRAGQMTNQKGLSGLELQYAPQRFQMEQQSGGLTNQLRQMQIQQMKNEMANGGGIKYGSTLGKLFEDYQQVAQRYGENSPQAMQFKAALDLEAQGKPGMTVYDPVTGNPLVATGNQGSRGTQGGGGTYIDEKTGKIVALPTNQQRSRDQRAIAGSENLQAYVQNIAKSLPQFQTAASQAKVYGEGLLNKYAGTNFEGPSVKAKAESDLIASAEGFINNFGLNATNENVEKAIKIFKPHGGESPEGYQKRVNSQLAELIDVENRAKQRQAQGINVGQSQMPQFQQNQNMAPQQQQLHNWAQEAIAQGADPMAVQARMQQMGMQ